MTRGLKLKRYTVFISYTNGSHDVKEFTVTNLQALEAELAYLRIISNPIQKIRIAYKAAA